MLDYSKVRFLWRGDAGRKVSSGRYDKIYDMGPRAATGDATFATAATRPIVDELSDWYGLAVDPAATNTVQRSQEFDNAYWTKTNLNTTGPPAWVNVGVAPDGTTTAEKIIASTTNTSDHFVSRVVDITSGNNYTWSVFAKKGEYNFLRLSVSGSGGGGLTARFAIVNLDTGTLVSETITGSTRISNVGNGWYRCSITTATSSGTGTPTVVAYVHNAGNDSAYAGDDTSGIFLWGAQFEPGSVATQYKKTEGTTTAYSAVVAPITDAIPVTGTIIVWDNMVNAFNGVLSHRIFESEDLSTSFVRLFKDSDFPNQLALAAHNNTKVSSANLLWQPSNQRKRWFFAMTFNGSTVQVYRGDVQGNISKVIDGAYTPTNAAIRDMYLHSTAAGAAQVGASFLDIMTYDAVMTAEQIQNIYYGTIPVFQQTGYAGTFVDKFRQKVQAEPSSTYDTTLESTVLADWSEDIFGVYDADASAFFSRGFDDGATLENLDATNTFILALKAL